jgi:dipeptidyl aminopeptidase/acylaminoacyl peptidase
MMPKPRVLAAAVCSALLLAPGAPGQTRPSVDSVLDALHKVRGFRQVAVSPDGTAVAWVERRHDARGQETRSAIFLAGLPSGSPRRVTGAAGKADFKESDVSWSPDSKSLAFLSDAGGEGQRQLWIASTAGGSPRKITSVTGQLEQPRWSPDGKSIAFLFTENSTQEPGALVAYKQDSGVVAETIEEQRIAVADVASGKVRMASPANLYVYDYDWAPDGTRFAAEAAEGSGTNNYWIAQLYLTKADTGEARSLWKPPFQIACPRFSPDGKAIAVIHGIMSDEGSTGGDIYLVGAAGGSARNSTPDLKASATALFWLSAGELMFTEHADGEEGVASLDTATGKVTTRWRGPSVLSSFSPSRNGSMTAAVWHSFDRPPEVCAGALGAWKPLTNVNAGVERFWSKAESLHWDSDRLRVQGWLLYPPHFDPGKKYPLVVVVHGGPSALHQPGWPSRWTATLPSQGYLTFLPNPRGSYGQGEAFTQANVRDFGHGDLRDILAGVDAVAKIAPVDEKRIGLVGWSYGGYMAMWAVTQTQRFAAVVAGAGIVDWRSYYGQNRIDRWMEPFFGASVYQDPAVYEKSSPIAFIKNVKTPTLVLHGDRDSEVPTPQGYEFWHALKTLGVPTELVIYENEGHGLRDPEHQRDTVRRTIAWFDKYLK